MDRYMRLMAPILVVVLAGCSSSGSALVTASQATQRSTSPPPVRSEGFKEPFTYTLPPGWSLSGTGARYYSFAADHGMGTELLALSGVVAARSDCSRRPEQGVGSSSDAMTNWLSTNPALDATTPRPITLGSAAGSWLDAALAPDWKRTCPNGLTLVTRHPDGPESMEILAGDKMRIYVLDVPGGDTVTILARVPDKTGARYSIEHVAPIVESFDFTG
jgi:hypothetical protein